MNPPTPELPPYKIVPLASLKPYERNARLHSDAQVEQVAAAIRQWGFTSPILIEPDGSLIAGHCRAAAAKLVGMTEIPAIVLAGLSPDEKKALVIADNKLALNASWDNDLLRLELSDLKLAGFDLNLSGFGELELAEVFADRNAGQTDPDDAPPVEPVAVSHTGDIWLLGRHRLACGDSADAATVTAALAGAKPHLMVTDPPYGVEYDADWRNRALRADGSPIAGQAVGKVKNDGRSDWREAWALFPGDVAYCWHADRHASSVQASLEAAGFAIRCQIIWVKQQFAIGRGDYHWQHEPCWYAVRKGATGHWAGDRKQTTAWMIDKPAKSETGHSTQKPVECMKRPMENNSIPGDAVYDPFCGSGTSIISATMSGRVCIGIELSPVYVDVGVRRWQSFSGGVAVLEGDGRTFDEIAAARATPAAADQAAE